MAINGVGGSSGLMNMTEITRIANGETARMADTKDLVQQRTGSDSTVVNISKAAQQALQNDGGSTATASPLWDAKKQAETTRPDTTSAAAVNQAAAAFYAQMSNQKSGSTLSTHA